MYTNVKLRIKCPLPVCTSGVQGAHVIVTVSMQTWTQVACRPTRERRETHHVTVGPQNVAKGPCDLAHMAYDFVHPLQGHGEGVHLSTLMFLNASAKVVEWAGMCGVSRTL
mgnify:CR=1 FL=1